MAVPATGDMNNPSHGSEHVKSMLDPDSEPGASPEAKLDLGWTTLLLGLLECEMFMVRTLVGTPRNQSVQRVRLNVGRGWQEGIVRARRPIHRQLERVSCSGITAQGRRCFGGTCIVEKVVEVESMGLNWLAK